MISSYRLVVLILLVLWSFGSTIEDEIDTSGSHCDDSKQAEIVTAYVDGNKFEIPYYEPGEKPIPAEMRESAVEVMNKILSLTREVIKIALIQGKTWTLYPRIALMAPRFITMSRYFKKKGREFKTKYGKKGDKGFLVDSAQIFPDLMDKAHEIRSTHMEDDSIDFKDKKERIRVGEKMMLIFDGVEELVRNSPVGWHLNFRKMKMNGSYVREEALECIVYMQESGLGSALDRINDFCCKTN